MILYITAWRRISFESTASHCLTINTTPKNTTQDLQINRTVPIPMNTNCIVDCLQIAIFMLKHITSVNVGAIITGVLCLVVLIGLKQVNERCRSRLKVPIPAELLVVILLHRWTLFISLFLLFLQWPVYWSFCFLNDEGTVIFFSLSAFQLQCLTFCLLCGKFIGQATKVFNLFLSNYLYPELSEPE